MNRPWKWLLLWGMALPVAAQSPSTVYAELDSIAHVPYAQRLASDAQGMLYAVTERAIIQMDVDGQVQATLGGSDAGHVAFDEVVDIDPGEGLIWVVADAGQGRLMRFSRTLMHVESLPVPRASDGRFGQSSREEPRAQESTAMGRPTALTVTPTGELFAIEEDSRVVVKWDASRRLERYIGYFGDAAGRLQEPVDLVSDESHLYVADRGLERVMVYDLFGGFVRSIVAEANLVSMGLTRNELFVVYPDRVRVFSTSGELMQQISFVKDAPVVGAAFLDEYVFLLIEDSIWRSRRSIIR